MAPCIRVARQLISFDSRIDEIPAMLSHVAEDKMIKNVEKQVIKTAFRTIEERIFVTMENTDSPKEVIHYHIKLIVDDC